MIDIPALVDDYIESITDERIPDGLYHPSSMFDCDRKAIYEVRGEAITNPVDAVTKRRFYIGHRLHEAVQRALESHPKVESFWPEVLVNVPGWTLTGHADGVVLYDHEYWLLEVKSIKRWAVKHGLPKDNNVKQAVAYWWAIKNYGFVLEAPMFLPGVTLDTHEAYPFPPIDLKGILMLYVEKEELQMWQYPLLPEPWWDTLVPNKVNELDLWRADEESLPPRLPIVGGKKNWLCGYCPFKDKCWNIDPHVIPYEVEEY